MCKPDQPITATTVCLSFGRCLLKCQIFCSVRLQEGWGRSALCGQLSACISGFGWTILLANQSGGAATIPGASHLHCHSAECFWMSFPVWIPLLWTVCPCPLPSFLLGLRRNETDFCRCRTGKRIRPPDSCGTHKVGGCH